MHSILLSSAIVLLAVLGHLRLERTKYALYESPSEKNASYTQPSGVSQRRGLLHWKEQMEWKQTLSDETYGVGRVLKMCLDNLLLRLPTRLHVAPDTVPETS